MKENKLKQKEYNTPQFQLVKTGESNKVFFAASGTPGSDPTLVSATLSNINNW